MAYSIPTYEQTKKYCVKQYNAAKVAGEDLVKKGKVKAAEAKTYLDENPDTLKKVGFVFAIAISAYISLLPTACGVALGMVLSKEIGNLKSRIVQVFDKQSDIGRGILGLSAVAIAYNVLFNVSLFTTTIPFVAGCYLGSQFDGIFQAPVQNGDDSDEDLSSVSDEESHQVNEEPVDTVPSTIYQAPGTYVQTYVPVT